MNESEILKKIQLRACMLGARLFRNSVGACQSTDGRYIKYGLCVGSSDLIGFFPITITPDMVGKTIGAFCAVEVKSGRRRSTEEQINFIKQVHDNGGLSGVARSEEDLIGILSMPLRKSV